MKAEEIRDMPKQWLRDGIFYNLQLLVLVEVAAQLAEINDVLHQPKTDIVDKSMDHLQGRR